MSDLPSLALVEYKLLKDEARTYADSGFRELQWLVVLIAAYVTVWGSNGDSKYFDNFWSVALPQVVMYFSLLIQGWRYAYLLVVRAHLMQLEYKIKQDNDDTKLTWESKIIPEHISPFNSLNFHAQIVLVGSVVLGFAVLTYVAVERALALGTLKWPIFIALVLEVGALSPVAWRLIATSKSIWQMSVKRMLET